MPSSRRRYTVHAGRPRAVVALTLVVVMRATPVLSQGDAEVGKRTAESWCSSCHPIDDLVAYIESLRVE